MKAVIVSTLLVGVSVGAAAQESLPRTPWGDPDLQGIWFYQIQTPRERPEAFADRAVLSPDEAAAYVAEQHAALESRQTRGDWLIRTGLTGRRTSRIVDPLNGRLPARTPAAQRRADTEGNLWVERAAMDPKTANGGSDASWDGPSRFAACRSSSECRFFKPQTMWPSRTSSASCVWYPSPPERLSLGRFGSGVDGPAGVGRVTLVVETTNVNGKWSLEGTGPNMRLVERFSRHAGTLDYEYTVDDAQSFASPWTVTFPFAVDPGPIYEVACHEGNRSMPLILSGARAQEREAESSSR
jgi:hypothetical protein